MSGAAKAPYGVVKQWQDEEDYQKGDGRPK
jgi:hypothetical protein